MSDYDITQMIRKDITERLRDRDNHDSIEAADEIERLRKERDEARREICNATAHPDMEAHERGWDCFKDNP